MKKLSLLAVIAVLATMFTASASASHIYGSIPGGTAFSNNGVYPIYGTHTRFGFYGANLSLFGAGASGVTIDFEYLGKEAGNTNSFWFQGIELFNTSTVASAGTWSTSGRNMTVNNVMNGLLNFKFKTSGGSQSVANGSNPNDAAGDIGVNFFVTLVADEAGTFGQQWDLWFDDQAQGDDNHDDMAIRMTLRGGTVRVPEPTALALLGLGLLGFAAARKRF